MPGVPRKSLPDALGAYRGGKPCLHVAATARPAKAETGTRQATAVKIRREKNRTTMKRTPNIGRISICLDGMSSVLYRAHVV